MIIACFLWFGIGDAEAALGAGFAGLVLCYTLGMAFVTYLMKKRRPERSLRSLYYELYMGNVMQLREDLREHCGNLPVVWAVLIKHFIPQILLVMFALGANADTVDADGNSVKVFGHYEGYVAWPYQVLGILTVVFTGFLIVSTCEYLQLCVSASPSTLTRIIETIQGHFQAYLQPLTWRTRNGARRGYLRRRPKPLK